MKRLRPLRWPWPYRFAFGIVDDTDSSTTDRVRIIYKRCLDCGVRPTRTTWTHPPRRGCGMPHPLPPDQGITLADDHYRELCLELKDAGVEIASHGNSSGNNTREETIQGFNDFRSIFGADPSVLTFHSRNAENAYWGASHAKNKVLKKLFSRILPGLNHDYYGHIPDSPYFCSDILLDRIKYIRLFRTLRLNVLKANPSMPYHLPETPHARFWFSATAQDLHAFRKITRRALDRVAGQDGLILIYAHLAEHALAANDSVQPDVDRALETLSTRNDCWMAGTSAILDRCLAMKNLIITRHRNGFVVSNPTDIVIDKLQLASSKRRVFLQNGDSLTPNADGILVIGELRAHQSICLFDSAELAAIGDMRGISAFESARMGIEEFIRILRLRSLLIRRSAPGGQRANQNGLRGAGLMQAEREMGNA